MLNPTKLVGNNRMLNPTGLVGELGCTKIWKSGLFLSPCEAKPEAHFFALLNIIFMCGILPLIVY